MNPDEFPELPDIDENGYFFFVPSRYVWDKYEDLIAGNSGLLESDE